MFDSGLLASDLERCCRCKNQWNRLAGRNKRAAASEPSEAKRAKVSPAAPSLGSGNPSDRKPSEQNNHAAKKKPRRNPYLCKRCGQIKKGHDCTHLKCGECATWYPLDEIGIITEASSWRCGVCKGTHVRTEQPARAKKVRRALSDCALRSMGS